MKQRNAVLLVVESWDIFIIEKTPGLVEISEKK